MFDMQFVNARLASLGQMSICRRDIGSDVRFVGVAISKEAFAFASIG
jgi:hypothetical protein